jgi:hypothetical protein
MGFGTTLTVIPSRSGLRERCETRLPDGAGICCFRLVISALYSRCFPLARRDFVLLWPLRLSATAERIKSFSAPSSILSPS